MNSQQKLTLMVAAFVTLAAPAGAVAPVRVVFAGQVAMTTAPVVRFPRGTLVPLRPVVAALGGRVGWEAAQRVAVVQYRGRRLDVDEAAHALRLDGQPLRGLIAPREAQGHLLVPLAALERLFGVRGRWLPQRHLLSFASVPAGGEGMGQVPGRKDSETAGGGTAPRPPASTGLALLLTTDRPSYVVGTPVIFRLTVINLARAPVTLSFSSGQRYDFEVRRAGQMIWRWSAGRMFTQALTRLTLRPRERQVFTETWAQQDNHGQPVPDGTYEAIGIVTTMGRPRPQSPPITLRIGA